MRLLPLKHPETIPGATFLAYQDPQTKARTTSAREREIAITALSNDAIPVGSKLYYYDYQPKTYTKNDGSSIALTFSFIRYGIHPNQICAIALDDAHHILKTDENNPVPAEEWAFAEEYLADKKEKGAKLSAYTKIARTDFPELMHSFLKLCINGKIIIESVDGLGWKAEGSYAKVKKSEYYAHKLPKKYKNTASTMAEISISQKAGFFIGISKKTTGFRQAILTMLRYDNDLVGFYNTVALQKISDHATKAIIQQSMLITLLETTTNLIALHKQGIIHRDIKPDNILLCISNHWTISETAFGDYGLAVNGKNGVYRNHNPVGTLDYMAPEIKPTNSNSNKNYYEYSFSSDYFALGVTFEMTAKPHLFPTEKDNILFLADCLQQPNPKNRVVLPYIQLALIFMLQKATKQDLETLLKKYNVGITTEKNAIILYNLFIKFVKLHLNLFTHNYWCNVIATLESTTQNTEASSIDNKTSLQLLNFLEGITENPTPDFLQLKVFARLYFIWKETTLFNITSETWLSTCLHNYATNSQKLDDLYWLYHNNKRLEKPHNGDAGLSLEKLWDDAKFWDQLHECRKIIEDANSTDTDKRTQEDLLTKLLTECLSRNGTAETCVTEEPSSSPKCGP